jgi:hypothetical protein
VSTGFFQLNSKLTPAQLFVPVARVYSMMEQIPFHLQLNGPLDSLRDLLVPTSRPEDIIKVILLRKVTIGTGYYSKSRSIVLAEGSLSEIPPLASSPCDPRDNIHLNWEGTVRCSNNTPIGTFAAGDLSVKVKASVGYIA